MTLRRIFSVGAALAVAAIAAAASYSHMRHLAIQYGQEHWVASLLPLSVDGMLVVATLALGDGRRYRWSAWAAFWLGVTVSVVANALAAQPHVLARCISAWPAVAFLATVEVITRGGRGTRVVAAPPAMASVPDAPESALLTVDVTQLPSIPGPAINGERVAVAARKTDDELIRVLKNRRRVPREPDGSVPIQRAAKTLGIGPGRARRLLEQLDLLRTDQADQPAQEGAINV